LLLPVWMKLQVVINRLPKGMTFHPSYLDKARVGCRVYESGCGCHAKEYRESGPANSNGAAIGPALTPVRSANEEYAEEHERNDRPIGRRTKIASRSYESSLRQDQKDCSARGPDLI